ncbi:hypothetical protein BKA64DRAFT_744839 [Cadophora sp. MPI-SDFR-AT-0126]|nr:hypothetical protein BKA64DRAFT_744839 [Leotiomycetes sp. MPI-SDFR-AT-0126]
MADKVKNTSGDEAGTRAEDGTKKAPKEEKMGAFEAIEAPGYPKLADMMAQYSQTAIFRRFRSLNLFNLLRIQAELVELEDRLRESFKSNENGTPILLQDFFEMGSCKDYDLTELLGKIEFTLEKYNKTLLELSKVATLTSPHKAELHFIQRWLRGLDPAEGQSFLRGSERLTWSASDVDEYFVMGAERSDSDATTGRIIDWIITHYNHLLGRRIKHNANAKMGLIEYSGLKNTTKVLVTLLSSMLPALAVLALYFETHILKRIGIMIGMTFVFAAALTFGTSAKRIEIFAATAAFAAVEVVFIGSTDATKPS